LRQAGGFMTPQLSKPNSRLFTNKELFGMFAAVVTYGFIIIVGILRLHTGTHSVVVSGTQLGFVQDYNFGLMLFTIMCVLGLAAPFVLAMLFAIPMWLVLLAMQDDQHQFRTIASKPSSSGRRHLWHVPTISAQAR